MDKKEFNYYLKKYNLENTLIAIKAGGGCLNESLIKSIKELNDFGLNPILVHGGGNQIDEKLKEKNIEIKKINGKRVTDKKTLEIVKKTMYNVNKNLVQKINEEKQRSKGFNKIFYVKPISKELGFVGEVTGFNKKNIENCLNQKYSPIISSLGIDNKNQTYNINADTAFRYLIENLHPKKVIFLTPTGGVFKEGKLISSINYSEIDKLIKSKNVTGGMSLKLLEINELSKEGFDIQITSPEFLLEELFSNSGHGTYIKGKKISHT